jgi:hypothetical protein
MSMATEKRLESFEMLFFFEKKGDGREVDMECKISV